MRAFLHRSDEKMNLKSMKIDALVDLKSRIDAVLASKVSDERRALESELAKLTRYDSGGGRAKVGGRGDQVGKEARGFRDFRQRQGRCKEGPQEARRQEVTVSRSDGILTATPSV